jgi:hypothetical protein
MQEGKEFFMRKLILLALVGSLLGLVAVPAAAAPGGTDRPFKADLVGEITFEFGTERCAVTFPGPLTHTASWGNATHMGRVEAAWDHCPTDPTSGGFILGEMTMVAANGDEIVFMYENPAGLNPFSIAIDSGTGRFAEATGAASVAFGFTPQFLPPDVCEPGTDPFNPPCFDLVTPWPWQAWIEGTISY